MTKIQIYQMSQFALLFLIAGTVLLFLRGTNKSKSQFGVTEADLWEQKKKDAPFQKSQIASPHANSKAGDASTPLSQIGAAFPAWKESTAAHDILGVSPQAPLEVIEAAYKSLLKKYHPDRFQSWGSDYADRAHVVVFRLQQARDEMLRKRS